MYSHACMYIHKHTHLHTHMHTQTYMHTHTHTEPNRLPKVNRLWVPGPMFLFCFCQLLVYIGMRLMHEALMLTSARLQELCPDMRQNSSPLFFRNRTSKYTWQEKAYSMLMFHTFDKRTAPGYREVFYLMNKAPERYTQ